MFLPCKNIEWLLLEIGKILLVKKENNKEINTLIQDLIETTTDLFKIVNNEYGLAVVNYFSAFQLYITGNKEKASRLLEMVAHIFKNPLLIYETQYYAALMNYPTNLRRSINLLENCLILVQKDPEELKQSIITSQYIEDMLNRFRREFIIRDHESQDKSYLFKVIDDVIHYYYNQNDLLSLSACYYESGIIFDKLGYEDTAEEYFVESAIISSEHQQWKLYSKALINLVVKFFEKGRVTEAEDYLNDLIQVASYLKDEGLHKKVETLLLSLKKIKEIKPAQISTESQIKEYISEIDSNSSQISPTINQNTSPVEYETNLNPDEELNLLQSLEVLSNYEAPQPDYQETTPSAESSQIDPNFLSDFKEPINQVTQNEVVISNEVLSTVNSQETAQDSSESNSFYAIRDEICNHFKIQNYEIFTDYRPVKGSVTVDIVAIRGKIRKLKIFLMITSDNEGEIELSLNLLISIFDSAERIVYVNSSNPRPPMKRGGVLVIYRLQDLPD